MKILNITTFIISLFLVFSCASRKHDDNAPGNKVNGNQETLTDIYWKLTSINGKPISQYAAPNKEPFLMLEKEGKRVEGTGGCNSMGGSYKLQGENQISFSDMVATEMACGDMILETEFYKVLEATNSYQSTGKELRLLDTNGQLLALFEASASH